MKLNEKYAVKSVTKKLSSQASSYLVLQEIIFPWSTKLTEEPDVDLLLSVLERPNLHHYRRPRREEIEQK